MYAVTCRWTLEAANDSIGHGVRIRQIGKLPFATSPG